MADLFSLISGGNSSRTPHSPDCSHLSPPVIPGIEVRTVSGTEIYDFTVTGDGAGTDFCNVTVTLTHPGAEDTVYITLLLPLSGWNGRYLATGGGGLAAGAGDLLLGDPVSKGWAASSTDGGLSLNQTINPQLGGWILGADGSYNEALVENLARRSIHDMVEVSKDLIEQFYQQTASYSYYHGCSGGGRQGYTAAAVYPHDFDGGPRHCACTQ